MVLWRPTRPSRTNTQKRCPLHSRGLECKSRKSRATGSNRQIWAWNIKWSRYGAGQRLAEFYLENALVIANTLKSDWLYSLQSKMEKFYTVSKNKPRSWRGSDYELLIATFRLKLKKVGKTTWQFRYDLNQITYDYTVEVTNKFKELDLIECLKNYGQRFVTLYRRQWSRPSPRKRNAQRQNGCLRRPYRWLRNEVKLKAKEKRKDIPIWMQSSKEYKER